MAWRSDRSAEERLRLALVSCSVAMYSVLRASGDFHFHYINLETRHRVRMVTLDAETDQDVSRRDLLRGSKFEKNRYVLLDDKDLAAAKFETLSNHDRRQVRPTRDGSPNLL